jgi:aryl-alcohol dehydrogenase-like predicted oxidoreductase
MKYRQLGSTGISVSEIGMGCWAIGGPVDLYGIPVGWGEVDDRESEAAIHRALDLGINFFDTADVYGEGHSEELLGRCLQGKDVVIATKVGNSRRDNKPIKDFSEAHIRKQLESSLKRLKRESIDIYQLHNPPPEIWQDEKVFGLLRRLKDEGKIRAAGVSISTMEEGIHLLNNAKADTLQVLFNILNQEPAKEVLPLAKKTGVGVIVRVPLASGLLTGKFNAQHVFPKDDNRRNFLSPKRFGEALERVEHLKQLISSSGYTLQQVALAFLLRFDVVVIPGAKTADQVEQNVAAGGVPLEEQIFQAIRQEFDSFNFYLRYNVRV